MVSFLLFCCSFLNAAFQDSADVFYFDIPHRQTREIILPEISTGPAHELDAYLTYISDFAYLSSFELSNKAEDVHKANLLAKVYSNYELPEIKILDCVENVIELGLGQLSQSTLTSHDVQAYKLLNIMILGLSDSLTPDRQRRFWVGWIVDSPTLEEKTMVFDLYIYIKRDIHRAYNKLKQYNKLLEYALRKSCLAVPADHETDT